VAVSAPGKDLSLGTVASFIELATGKRMNVIQIQPNLLIIGLRNKCGKAIKPTITVLSIIFKLDYCPVHAT